MGFFFKRASLPNPKITANGIEIQCSQSHDEWTFTYRGTDFVAYRRTFTLPSIAELDAILTAIESLLPEMRSRLVAGLQGWCEPTLDTGESYLVELSDFATTLSFNVMWSDGKSWADLAADFTIRENRIIDESWGD